MELKGLVSFSLYGDNPLYLNGALRNCEIWANSPFDVDCRFYCGKSVSVETKEAILASGGQVMHMNGWPEDHTSTFWRFGAFGSSIGFYDYVLSRDVDSRPFEREFGAISTWLESRYPVHVIRDHPYHGVPILAGLFGVKSSKFEWFAEKLPIVPPDDFYKYINRKFHKNYPSNDFYQVDQHWLRREIFPHLTGQILAHDRFFNFDRRRHKIWLDDEEDNRFCGEGFDENDQPRYPEHRDVIRLWPNRYGRVQKRW